MWKLSIEPEIELEVDGEFHLKHKMFELGFTIYYRKLTLNLQSV